MVGKTAKREYSHESHNEELRERIKRELYEKAYAAAKLGNANKSDRKKAFGAPKAEFIESLSEDHTYNAGMISTY